MNTLVFNALLKQTGMSLHGVTNLTGFSYSTVSSWSCGRRAVPPAVITAMDKYAQCATFAFEGVK